MSGRPTRNAPEVSSTDLRMHATPTARHSRIAGTRRLACVLATLAAVGLGALGGSATLALADGCPNEQLRSENNSTRLPECRAYERVTPSYTEGFPVETPTFSDDGAVAYTSTGSIAGNGNDMLSNGYVATRSSSGWATRSLNPPAATFDSSGTGVGSASLSADLRSMLMVARNRESPADSGYILYLRGPDGSMTRVGQGAVPGLEKGLLGLPFIELVSADLSHVVFAHYTTGSGNAQVAALYEFVGTGNEGPGFPVSVDNNGDQVPPEACAAGMSSDGRVIAFGSSCGGGIKQLWARVGGSATIAVSRSECTRTSGDPAGACNGPAPAQFAGMATDGSRVFFTTTQQLVNSDTDQTNDLYECDIPPGAPAPVGAANPCASLTEVSHDATAANVQSAVKVSEDGSRLYFVAQGVLAANLGTNDAAAVAGDENLYVWEKDAAHPAGQTTFVTKLESGIGSPQSTPDGRYLVFSTSDRLLASDTDEATDVYRYDAQTGALLRLSTDTQGTGGNEPGFAASLFFAAGRGRRELTSDGSTVVFETAEALSPADTDGVTDVYQWHEGQVSLISSGGGQAIGITPSGQDIYFLTGVTNISVGKAVLDARIAGGFPLNTPEPCSGEACQGALAPQPQLPGASGSAVVNGPGSPLTAETPATNSGPKPQSAAQKLAKALKACRAKHDKKKRKACEKRARTTYRRTK
jgi:hypothetical protein